MKDYIEAQITTLEEYVELLKTIVQTQDALIGQLQGKKQFPISIQ